MLKKSIINRLRSVRLPAPLTRSEHVRGLVKHLIPRRRRLDQPLDDYLIQKSDFGIRLANIYSRLDTVEMLVTRMYRQRGYRTDETTESTSQPNLRRVTLEACRNNHTVGTITVAMDGPGGLNAEDLYRDEVLPYREKGAKICEFTRLALDIDQCGKEALGGLFHLAFIFAHRIHGATDVFIEVNPRHAAFYRRKLGMKVIGQEKVCRRVNAPAVLLHQKLTTISEQIIRFGGFRLKQNKSFYTHFMPPWEEREMAEQIRAMLAQTEIKADESARSAVA